MFETAVAVRRVGRRLGRKSHRFELFLRANKFSERGRRVEEIPESERVEFLRRALVALNCPEDKTPFMASQLDKRAKALEVERGVSYEEAVRTLLSLMSQGWAAPK